MLGEDTYVVYKGDDVVAIGTRSEVARALGVSEPTIAFYASPSNMRRCDVGENRTCAVKVSADEALKGVRAGGA